MRAIVQTGSYQKRKDDIDAYYAQFMTGDMDADYETTKAWENSIRSLNADFTVEIE